MERDKAGMVVGEGWPETLSLAPHPRAGPQSTAAIHFIIELDTAIISGLEKQRKDLLRNGLIFLKVIDHVKMRVLVKSNKDSAVCELALGVYLELHAALWC